MFRKTLSFLLVALLAAGVVRAQRVGVVMSGGGAKGLYHIGVLEAFEECGVPIDYVAGTSMGSIIAAMYAAGYSPAEMREIVSSGVVKEWVSGRIDPRYTAYYRQVSRLPSFVTFRLNLGDDSVKLFRTPTNLISSTQIDMALTELFAPATAACGGDFDELMVPFLCVASDMNAREPVVLRSGDLSEAVRSSMSIPLVFKPMKIDSMLLYDGGIYDNFPWRSLDVGFRPDLLIGSICTDGGRAPSEENGLFDQAFMLAMYGTDYEMPRGRSITVRRAVDVNMLDFDRAVEIMDAGYADAMEKMPEILERIRDRRTPEQYAARREVFRARCPELRFGSYDIEGLTRAQREYVRDFVKLDEKHHGGERELNFAQLRDNLYSVLADGDFSMEFPRALYDSVSGRYTFRARFVTKPNFRLLVGGNVSSTAFNQAYIGATYRRIGRVAQSLGVDLYLGPLYTWGSVGGRTDFYAWKPLFLDYSYNFSVQNYRHGSFGNVTKINNTQPIKQSASFLSLAVGMPLTQRSLFTLRANGGHVNYRYDSEDFLAEETDLSRFSFFGLKGEIGRNTFDKWLYPRRGSNLTFSAIYVVGRDKYEPYDMRHYLSKEFRQWGGVRFTYGEVLRPADGTVVLLRGEPRRGLHEPPGLHDRQLDAPLDAGLRAHRPHADDLHARLPGASLRGCGRDADLRPDAQLLLPCGLLRDVPRPEGLPTGGEHVGGGPPLAQHRRGVAGLPHAHRAGEPVADQVRGRHVEEHVPDLQLRLRHLRPQGDLLLTC